MHSFVRLSTVLCCILVFAWGNLAAQDDEFKVNIYGFTSTVFSGYTSHKELVLGNGVASNYFAIAQTDIFLSGNLGGNFKFLIDLQILNDFGNQLTVNPFLHQAWGEWRPSDAFGIRVGRLLTPFGLFNAVHSRPALYWFIERPLAYQEPPFVEEMSILRPEFSNLAVSGSVRLTDDIKFDYNAYLGNTGIQFGNGIDLNAKKLFGARVALRTDKITLGFSPVFNRIEREDSVSQNNNTIFAVDLRAELDGFTLLGEYTAVNEAFERLPGIPIGIAPRAGNFNETAWWASLGYNITESWLVYLGYDSFRNTDSDSRFFTKPFQRFRGGLNFKPVDNVLLKAEIVTV